MGHSNPAGAAEKRGGKTVSTTPPEEMIRVFVMNTKQGIFTANVEYARALVDAYENFDAGAAILRKDLSEAQAAVKHLGESTSSLLARAEKAEEELASARAVLSIGSPDLELVRRDIAEDR